MKAASIQNIFRQFSQMQVIVIGDAMIDTYLYGNTERNSAESGVPVISLTNRENRLGGAANVAMNIRSLGAHPILLTVIGDDENGKIFRGLLKDSEITDEGVFTDSARPTTLKCRVISHNSPVLRFDEESVSEIEAGIEEKIIRKFKDLLNLRKPDVIVFSDYDKGVITQNLFNEVNKLAVAKGIKVAVDPKYRNFKIYNNVHLLKPNFEEFSLGAGLFCDKHNPQEIEKNIKILAGGKNIEVLLLTLSENGIYVHDGKNGTHFPATQNKTCDVTGAGDTVISVAALALAANADCLLMAELANYAGGLVCAENGVVPVMPEPLLTGFLHLAISSKEVNYQFNNN